MEQIDEAIQLLDTLFYLLQTPTHLHFYELNEMCYLCYSRMARHVQINACNALKYHVFDSQISRSLANIAFKQRSQAC